MFFYLSFLFFSTKFWQIRFAKKLMFLFFVYFLLGNDVFLPLLLVNYDSLNLDVSRVSVGLYYYRFLNPSIICYALLRLFSIENLYINFSFSFDYLLNSFIFLFIICFSKLKLKLSILYLDVLYLSLIYCLCSRDPMRGFWELLLSLSV